MLCKVLRPVGGGRHVAGAAACELGGLGRGLTLLSDVRLREGVDRAGLERGLIAVPAVVGATRLTGDYDHQLRVVCVDTREFESVIDRPQWEAGLISIEGSHRCS